MVPSRDRLSRSPPPPGNHPPYFRYVSPLTPLPTLHTPSPSPPPAILVYTLTVRE